MVKNDVAACPQAPAYKKAARAVKVRREQL